MEYSIQDVARRSGVTSRTLRHWGDAGLLAPSSVGPGGIRRYDDAALVRLQRILLLRALGLGIPAIRSVLGGEADDLAALGAHLDDLRAQRALLDRRMRAVETTIRRRKEGKAIMPEETFDGFDHTQHREEVIERWGGQSWVDSDAWWRGKTAAERAAFQDEQRMLAADWADAARRGADPADHEAQALAARHATRLAGIPGTPGYPDGPDPAYLAGLADLYVDDPRFAVGYDGGAEFVRDALRVYAERMTTG